MKNLLFFVIFSIGTQTMKAQDSPKIKILIGSASFVATTYDNETARGFLSLLPLTITMSELNRNEKYHFLPADLPSSPERPSTIKTGDLMLYGTNGIVLFYETFTTSYSYTPIGNIENPADLKAALGMNNPTVTFEVLGNSTGMGLIEQNKIDFKISDDGVLLYSGNAKKISLIDMNGKTLAVTTSNALNVNNYPKGIYILKAESLNQKKTIKIKI